MGFRQLLLLATAALGCTAAAAAPPAGNAARGSEVFHAQCGACHLAKPGQTPIGPSLYGVIGRKSGSWGTFKYTDAMRKSNLVWTPELLDQYLENPYAVVPGAAMGLLVPVVSHRADVIAYLATKPEELKHPTPPAP
jgi:cytochrome c